MKGIVFSIKRRDRGIKHSPFRFHFNGFTLKELISFYGLQILFIIVFIAGVVIGSLSLKNFDTAVIKRLDFLFISNLQARLEFSPFDLFCSSFASAFLFVLSAFLLSFTAWGMLALPFLCAFRGFSVGISSAYLFSQYHITGIGFYILVILPGTVLFLLAFVMSLKEAFLQSVSLFKSYFSAIYDATLLKKTKTYLYRNCIILIFTAFVDMILFILFSDMFKF